MAIQIFETPQQTLKNRVKDLQEKLRAKDNKIILHDFQKYVIECNPKYSSPEGMELMRKVWYKYACSVELTEIMEQMVINYKIEDNE